MNRIPQQCFLFVLLSIFSIAWVVAAEQGRVLQVGPGKEFIFPSVAAQFAVDGDVIEIDAAGIYQNDHVMWTQNNITIKGVNGRPHLHSFGLIPNRKGIWVIQGNGVTITNIEMSGARVKDRNGAAIRLEGENFTLSDCFFHDNENGLLAGMHQPESKVTIENCEFSFNGKGGGGQTHNVYIGHVGSLVFRNNYSHHAYSGHLVKSRAVKSYILYNRLFEGNSSYSIDLSSGGYGLVMGNVLYQGPDTENSALLTFGPEGLTHKLNVLDVFHNTFLNERHSGAFIKVKEGAKASVVNNLFVGKGMPLIGKADFTNNVQKKDLFERFGPDGVVIKDKFVSLLKDKARPISSYDSIYAQPEHQYVNDRLVKRVKLGLQYDIGATELE